MDDDPAKARFLLMASTYISVAESARRAGILPAIAKEWLEDRDFKRRYEEAVEVAKGKTFGLLMDAVHAQGDFQDISLNARVRLLERVSMDLNPDITGRNVNAVRQLIFQSQVPRNPYRDLPDIDGQVKELPNGTDPAS